MNVTNVNLRMNLARIMSFGQFVELLGSTLAYLFLALIVQLACASLLYILSRL